MSKVLVEEELTHADFERKIRGDLAPEEQQVMEMRMVEIERALASLDYPRDKVTWAALAMVVSKLADQEGF